MPLFFLFIFVPLIELMILLRLADVITGWWTFVLVIVTGIVGATLARRQGWSVIHRIQSEIQAGKPPTKSLGDALMIFVAGALLLTPGILTDVFGFSLLIPFFRNRYRQVIIKWFRNNVNFTQVTTSSFSAGSTQGPFGGQGPFAAGPGSPLENDDDVIDSYVVDRRDEPDA